MPIRTFFIAILVLWINESEAQLNLSPIWCFGDSVGLDFRTAPAGIFKSSVKTSEGSAGATDQYGVLWFYTDGMKVFDRNHRLMPNGTGLTGSPSSSQSAIVLQHRSQASSGQFYIFTVPEYGGGAGFCYSIVDMNLNGGLGDVKVKNIGLGGIMAEQMQPAMHANGKDYWIVIKGYRNDSLHTYLIDSSGIARKGSYRLGNRVNNTIGTMRFTKDYSRFAFSCYDFTGYVQICDFDATTGVISNAMIIDNLYDPYGVHFSPDGTKLYVAHLLTKKLRQYDLSTYNSASIKSSAVAISDNMTLGNINYAYDGHLYVCQTSEKFIARIADPNLDGTACNFQLNSVSTGNYKCIYGLPLFYIYPRVKFTAQVAGDCLEDSVAFISSLRAPFDTCTWQIDTGTGYFTFSGQPSFKAKLNFTGQIKVRIISGKDTVFDTVILRKCQVFDGKFILSGQCITETLRLYFDFLGNAQVGTWYLDTGLGYQLLGQDSMYVIHIYKAGRHKIRFVSHDLLKDTFIDVVDCDKTCSWVIPNVFTPNADLLNDSFDYVANCLYDDFQLLIFNRWGEKLFETHTQGVFWNGKYQGTLCPDGVYLYLIQFKDTDKQVKRINGLVHLLR